MYELAEIHRQLNEFDQAQQLFEAALKAYPDFQEAQVGLAATLMAQQKPSLALPHLQRAVALNADDEVAWYRLAQADRAVGNTEEQKKLSPNSSACATRSDSNKGRVPQKK